MLNVYDLFPKGADNSETENASHLRRAPCDILMLSETGYKV